MCAYESFAYFYDGLMQEANYKKRTDYILKLFKKFGQYPTLLLDVACGTGGFSKELARRGIEVIGADMSENMLSVARETSMAEGLDILYLCQRAEELDLYGTVNGAICCMDSLNHITDKTDLKNALKRISLFLEPQKLFIFDVNTVYKHKQILGNNSFVLENENVFCIWQNSFDPKSMKTHITLDLFENTENNYIRSTEEFDERAYSEKEIVSLLKAAKLEILGIFGDLTLKPPTEKTDRVFYVCKKSDKG